MSRNRNQRTSIAISENAEPRPKGITFNYSENFNRVVELTTENYTSWKTNILYLLMINNLESYVTSEKVKKLRKRDIKDDLDDYLEDKFEPNLVYDKETTLLDIKNDVMVKWIIINSLGEKTRSIIEGQGKTAFHTWEILEKSFTTSSEKRTLEIKNKINNMKYNEDEDINIFIAKLQNAIDELENLDHDLSDSSKAGILNRTLPENLRFINVFQYKEDWNKLCTYVKNVIPEIIFSNMKETMKLEETNNQLFAIKSKVKDQNRRTIANSPSRRKNGKCFKCGLFGHFFRECKNKISMKNKKYPLMKHNKKWNKHKNLRRFMNRTKGNNKGQINSIQNAFNKTSSNTKPQNNNSGYELVLNCITSKFSTNYINKGKHISQWILDSGSSVHITNSIIYLTNIKDCNEEIILPNGKIIHSTKQGDFIGYLNNIKFILNDVFYVPELNKNIISVSKLTQQSYKVVFFTYNDKPCSSIYDKNGKRITNITSNIQNIYILWLATTEINFNNKPKNNIVLTHLTHLNKAEKINLWHRRLGHFNINNIKNKLLKLNIHYKCPICSNSKLRNLPHKKTKNKSKYIFELIYMDLVGPITESIHNNKYFISILDDFSRFGWVIFIQNKSDTFDHFYKWVMMIENTFKKTITHVRTDNGTEFCNRKFHNFLSNKGIIHQLTTPYNPQQNGRVERLNGTLISSAKALLNESKLSTEFWEYAVDTANYIHNRIPHAGINYKIPFEILFKTKVDYSHFKVFGCRVFSFLPKPFRSKFDNNALPGIFLGYHPLTNSYKILNISNNKIIYCRSIDFFENNPGNSKLSHPL